MKEKYEAALQAAKDVEAEKTATQDEINTAWSDLIDALHYLSFVAGDKSQLEIPMEIADSINRDLFTPDSLDALDEAYAAAEDLLDDEEVLEADITAAVDALYDAIYGLVYRADVTELQALVTKGDGIVDKRRSVHPERRMDRIRDLSGRGKGCPGKMKTPRRMRWIPQQKIWQRRSPPCA